jgi:NitT/TauT family transport system substrate-binding protein
MAWDLLDRMGGCGRREAKDNAVNVETKEPRRVRRGGGMGIASLLGHAIERAAAADLTPINFVEAVHNLGYINLYVGMRSGLFEPHGLKMTVSAAGGDTQAFAAVLGKSAQFAIGDATMVQMSREAGGPGIVVGTVIQRAHYFGVSRT